MKNRYIWKLYSGVDWYIRQAVDIVGYAFAFIGIGAFLAWLVNVG